MKATSPLKKFQSTHPVRGATRGAITPTRQRVFQSTHPVRGATIIKAKRALETLFQSTHPVRGATKDKPELVEALDISIHAPRAGCDSHHTGLFNGLENFNPRTPCGVRRNVPVASRFRHNFNPRTPCGVRRTDHRRKDVLHSISIHAPRAGCDGKFDGFTRPNLRKRYKKVSVQPKKRAKKKIKEMLCSHSQMLCSHSHIFGWISGAKVPEFPAR